MTLILSLFPSGTQTPLELVFQSKAFTGRPFDDLANRDLTRLA